MQGYKVFEPDWTCRGFQYAVGETFEEDVVPSRCNRGFHFCKELKDCFNYYPFNPDNKVAEIEALGDIDTETDDSKCCTNKIRIVRELTWEEVLKLVNIGKANAGFCNSGNRNSGNRNSGDCNSGDWNSGDCNSGDCNSGDWNSGDWNSGDWNSGDWNKTSFSSGCFNTKEAKILMFNKPSDWTFRDWWNSEARSLLNRIQKDVLEWVWSNDMTDQEKEDHPEYKTTGGYPRDNWPFFPFRELEAPENLLIFRGFLMLAWLCSFEPWTDRNLILSSRAALPVLSLPCAFQWKILASRSL